MRTDHDTATLADRLRSGPLSRAELEQLAQDLLGMLASLHAEGTLHRDLNPASIRLDSAGRLHSSKIGSQRGGAGSAYLSPEVRAGGDADVAADLFACGVLLADAAGPDAPAPVLVLIGMLTAPEPDLRPASATEALALLGVAPTPAPTAAPTPAPPAPRAPVAAYRQTFEKPSVPPPALPPPPPMPPVPAVPMPAVPGPAVQDVPTEAIQFPPLAASAAVLDTPLLTDPAVLPAAYPPAPAFAYPRRRPGRRLVLATVAAVLGLGIVAGGAYALSDGGESTGTEIPAPAAAPLDQQLDDLDGVIDTLGR